MKKILLPLSLAILIVAAFAGAMALVEFKSVSAPAKNAVSEPRETVEKNPSYEAAEGSKSPISNENPGVSSGAAACSAVYDPVCGDDGKTYPNACEAAVAKVGRTVPGSCVQDPRNGPETEDSETSAESSESRTETLSGSVSRTGVSASGTELAYFNEGLGYGFSLPKKTYFSGFGARDGASHSVGVGRAASPETFELSEVKVRFYKNRTLPEAARSENGFYEDPETGVTYLSLSGSTLTVEADRTVSSDIVDSIIRSAYVR